MPNHVTNNLTFHGDPEAIRKMLEAVKSEEEGFGSIDFNKLLPMPPELNIESGSRTTDGINAYNAFVEIYTLGQDPEKMDLLNIPEDREKAFLNMRKDINKETWELGRAAFRNIQRFGHATWYSWCTCSWGTKWNAYDFNSDGNSLSFHTAWSPPLPVIRKLAECFPDIGITHEWADEDIGHNCGRSVYSGGKLTEEFIPADGKEAYEFAASVLDADLSDYGLVLNADETDYIWAGSERYEVMELLGQRVLHTDSELTLSDIPLGMYLYHLGTTDLRDRYNSVSVARPENFGGSIVTLEPIDTGNEGVRSLAEDEGPRITCDKLTMEELLRETVSEEEGMGGLEL